MLVCCLSLLLFLFGCSPKPNRIAQAKSPPSNKKPPEKGQVRPAYRVVFSEVSRTAGLGFVCRHGSQLPLTILETTGGGCAFLDYNADGWMDIYLVSPAGANGLFRNRGDGSFVDVTREAKAGDDGRYHMGCCAADIDNDGDIDLYLTNYGRDTLLLNSGNGAFTDYTSASGAYDNLWSVGCAFLDADLDGRLDLYVANYLDFSKGPKYCKVEGVDMNCPPFLYPAQPHRFYRNLGGGRFREMTAAAGMRGFAGHGLGVISFDYNNDGRPDVLVANDGDANFLFRNEGGGKFSEVGLTAGVAYSQDGRAGSSMGMDFSDISGDGLFDFVVTNFQHEVYTFYRGGRSGQFTEDTDVVGLAEATLPYLGWGTGFVDYDNDADRDLFFANGHVRDNVARVDGTTSFAQRQQVFENRRGVFSEVSSHLGEFFARRRIVGRGAAFGDYDNDGDVDILVNNLGGRPALLRNDSKLDHHWLALELTGGRSNRSAVGARVTVVAGGRKQIDEVRAGGSYASCNDPRLHFGLGKSTTASLEIRWPSGLRQHTPAVAADHLVRVTEGRAPEVLTMPRPSRKTRN